MDSLSFTAGITFNDNSAMTVDVIGIDATGIAYESQAGSGTAEWKELKAVMLATTDHMLESGGSLLAMAQAMADAGDRADQAEEMRRFGLRVLQQAAPRVCPLGEGCGLTPGQAADQ